LLKIRCGLGVSGSFNTNQWHVRLTIQRALPKIDLKQIPRDWWNNCTAMLTKRYSCALSYCTPFLHAYPHATTPSPGKKKDKKQL